jgi:Family of unknown function (DUF6941)
MRIAWAIPCKFLEVHDGLGTMVGAGANHYAVAEFPTTLSVWVAVQVQGHRSEVGVDHSLVLQPLGPDMEPCAPPLDMRFRFPEERNPNEPAGWEVGALIPTLIQFVAEEEGTYAMQLSVDDKVTTIPLYVRGGDPRV